MFCLDMNVVIGVMTNRSPPAVGRLRNEYARGTRILVPAIVVHELQFGIANSSRHAANEQALMSFLAGPVEKPSFDLDDAAEAADIRMFLKRKGTPIGPYDILIAAQARRRNATLVTANIREFRRVPRLAVEDWTKP